MYKEIDVPFNTKYSTWIIAFCPDTDSFFATNERFFFWESEEEFETEEAAIYYFEHQIQYFVGIENEIMNVIFPNAWSDKIFLENTNKWYYN